MNVTIAKIKSHFQENAGSYIIAATAAVATTVVIAILKKPEISTAHNIVIPQEWLERMNESNESLLLTTNIGNYLLKKTDI